MKYRKKSGLSQDELAQKLGVTFQAVSKWENAKAAPDITFLPIMADIFGCYTDERFSREVKTEIHYDLCVELLWHDDGVVRKVIFDGKKFHDIIKQGKACLMINLIICLTRKLIKSFFFRRKPWGEFFCDVLYYSKIVSRALPECRD